MSTITITEQPSATPILTPTQPSRRRDWHTKGDLDAGLPLSTTPFEPRPLANGRSLRLLYRLLKSSGGCAQETIFATVAPCIAFAILLIVGALVVHPDTSRACAMEIIAGSVGALVGALIALRTGLWLVGTVADLVAEASREISAQRRMQREKEQPTMVTVDGEAIRSTSALMSGVFM